MTTNEAIRTYASYVIYKGKAALSVKVIPPSYSSLSSHSRIISREGGLLLEFAPVGSIPREYDWTKKTTFLLDATECGDILSIHQQKSNSVEFVHDPNANSDKAGQINKKFRMIPTPDGNGYFLTLQVNDKSTQSGPITYSLPITHGELHVLNRLMEYILPYLLGFTEVWNNPGLGEFIEPIPTPAPAPVWKKITQ
eukprot:CAMPEP_0196761150 /NCGR_PEP_ID=MMETSP1095-20130614/294_1 /TAXON_ID=96789 ORGANISM="Chromulina nebulosa, Strain UTEXLB2642" /NCGR_SAMPLE_ID=MMETSP1095 /ASSEMBLY_ACC=CAM_ASM_000446 /LENGTH=195 /DNA_ID=CAMNT_0042110315 /DNA_START=127 /DNA_END=714 /DNA_ORIENTATION=+